MAVEIENFECGPAPISEDINRSVHPIRAEFPAAEGDQPVNSLAEIDGLVSEENS